MPEFKTTLVIEADATTATKVLDGVLEKVGPDMVKAIKDAAKKSTKQIDNLTGTYGELGKGVSNFAKKSKKTFQNVIKAAKKTGGAVKEVADRFMSWKTLALDVGKALAYVVDRGTELGNTTRLSHYFGGSKEAAAEIAKVLDHTITKTEALQLSSSLAADKVFGKSAQAKVVSYARAIAATTDATHEQALEMMRSGEFTERFAAKFPVLNRNIEASIKTFETANNVTANQGEKLRIVTKHLDTMKGELGKINKMSKAGIMGVFLAQVKELADVVMVGLSKHLKGFIEDARKGLPKLTQWFKDLAGNIKKAFEEQGIVKFFDKLMKMYDWVTNAKGNAQFNKGLDAMVRAQEKARTPGAKFFKEQLDKEAIAAGKAHNLQAMKRLSIDKSTSAQIVADRKKTLDKILKRRTDREAKSRKQLAARRKAALKIERQEEIAALKATGREQVRNFEASYTMALAGLGGSWSGIISAQVDYHEKMRQFSVSHGHAAVDAAKQTEKQIWLNKKLSTGQKKAALLLRMWSKAGSFDVQEKLLMEQNVVESMEAGVAVSAADAKAAAIRIEQRINLLDVVSSIHQLEMKINMHRQVAARTRSKREKNAHVLMVKQLEWQLKKQKEIDAQKRASFQWQLKMAAAEKTIEAITRRGERKTALEDITNAYQALVVEAIKLQGVEKGANAELKESLRLRQQELDRALRAKKAEHEAAVLKHRVLFSEAQTRRKMKAVSDAQRKTDGYGTAIQTKNLEIAKIAMKAHNANERISKNALSLQARQIQGLDRRKLKLLELIPVLGAVGKAEARAAARSAAQQRAEELRGIRRGTTDLGMERATLQGGAGLGADQWRAGQRALEDIYTKTTTAQIELNRLQANPTGNAKAITHEQNKLSLLRLQLDERKKLNAAQDVTNTKSQVQIGFMQTMTAQAADMAKNVGQQLANVTLQIANTIGNTVSTLAETFVDMLSKGVQAWDDVGRSIGKIFLDVVANAAMSLGSYFVAAGTAQMFVPPYSGAGAIAGGLALMALGGGLKGMSSLLDSAPEAKAGSGGGKMSTGFKDSMPGQKTPKDTRPVHFYFSVSQEPWNASTDQQRWKSLRTWSKKMSRNVGQADPFTAAAKVGAKGR